MLSGGLLSGGRSGGGGAKMNQSRASLGNNMNQNLDLGNSSPSFDKGEGHSVMKAPLFAGDLWVFICLTG